MQQNFHTFQLFQFVFFLFFTFCIASIASFRGMFLFCFRVLFLLVFAHIRHFLCVSTERKKKTIILYFILFFSYSSNCFAVVLFSAVAPCRARGFHFVFIKGQFSFFWLYSVRLFSMGVSVDNVCGYLFENKGNTNECVFFLYNANHV